MEQFHFDHMPTFAELWDIAVKKTYRDSAFEEELIDFLRKNGLDEKSNIADVAAGGGFPALYLRKKGFNVDCFDMADDEIAVFRSNAEKLQVDGSITQSAWLDLKENTKKNYDFIVCRGNSFAFAAGGWNSLEHSTGESARILYKRTLQIFFDLLIPDGIIYLDKYKDSEETRYKRVDSVLVKGMPYDVILQTEIHNEKKERYARLLLGDAQGREYGLPNLMYALSEEELCDLAREVGFVCDKVNFRTEPLYNVFILRKI